MSAPAKPTLKEFLRELESRLKIHIAGKGTRCRGPILAITEGNDTFLIDSIADANDFFTSIWAPNCELGEQGEVDAFIALVTKARELDPQLQKKFDKLVPKKTTEQHFWRRYFAHAHALLVRLAPTSVETAHGLLSALLPPRDVADRYFKPKSTDPQKMRTLASGGELTREETIALFTDAERLLGEDAVYLALSEDVQRACDAGEQRSPNVACNKFALAYQADLVEHLGFERVFGLLSMHPPLVMMRFELMKDMTSPAPIQAYGAENTKILKLVQAFITTAQALPQKALERLAQRPDSANRTFAPAEHVDACGAPITQVALLPRCQWLL